jgi:hypothetical protein
MSNAAKVHHQLIMLFGVLHILLSVLGLYVIVATVGSTSFLHDDPSAPHVVELFYGMTVVNVLLLAGLGLAGYRLLCSGVAAIRFSNLICIGEISYLLLLPLLWASNLRSSIASATGIGNVGVMVQGVALYPVISLVALTICRGCSLAIDPPSSHENSSCR